MIENHVGSISDCDCILSICSILSHSNPDVADNSIVRIGKGSAIAINSDTSSWCSLSEYANMARDHHPVFYIDDSTSGKNNDTVACRHRIPQRALARIIEISDNVDRSSTAANCIRAETFGAWESQQSRSNTRKSDEIQQV